MTALTRVDGPSRVAYKWQAAAIVVLGLFLSVLDSTIVSVALPATRAAFSTDFNTVTWVATSYFLAQAAIIPITGYVSDRAGTKVVFVSALAIFMVGSLLCVLAGNLSFLIAARVLQGLGGGALMPTSFAIAYRAFPRDEWGRATTIIGVPVLLAPAVGPVLGGVLTTDFDWRAIFTINLPVGGIGLLLAVLLLRSRAADSAAGPQAAPSTGPFDGVGFVLSMVGFTVLVYGLTEAGLYGWGDPTGDRALLTGLMLVVLLIVVEWRSANPVLDVRFFLSGAFTRANLLLWVIVGCYYGTLFLIPFYFETVQGMSALTAGEIMIGQGVASAVGIAIAGELYNRVGPRILVGAGSIALALGMVGFTRLTLDTSGLSVQLWLALRGLGLGLTIIPLQNLAISVVRHREVAGATSLVNVLRQVFCAAGLAALVAITAQRATGHAGPIEAALRAGSPSVGVAHCVAGGTNAATCVQHWSVVVGLNDTFVVVLVVCGLGAALGWFVGRDPTGVAMRIMGMERLAEVFPHLSRLELAEVLSRMRPLSVPADGVVVRQGDEPNDLYVVARGQMHVTLAANGTETVIDRLGPGDFFGEVGLMAGVPRTASVIATSPAELLTMDRETFSELLAMSHPTATDLDRVMRGHLEAVR
jgi:EmrB/QacA subfamily drug resistance transporter